MSEVQSGVPDRRAGEHGAIVRALLWVALGAAVAVAAFVAVTPELSGAETSRWFEPFAFVLAAAVPGLVLLVFAAVRRARLGLDDEEK